MRKPCECSQRAVPLAFSPDVIAYRADGNECPKVKCLSIAWSSPARTLCNVVPCFLLLPLNRSPPCDTERGTLVVTHYSPEPHKN